MTTGFLFIALAVSILVAYAINKLWYIIPVFILLVGVWTVFLGTLPRPPVRGVPSVRVYLMTWGIIGILFGGLLIVNDLYPNNLPLLVALFLIVIGVVAVLTYVVSPKRVR